MEKRPIGKVIQIRSREHGTDNNPPPVGGSTAARQPQETTQVRNEKRRNPRYREVATTQVRSTFEYELRWALYRMGEKYGIPYISARELAREFLDKQRAVDVERAAA